MSATSIADMICEMTSKIGRKGAQILMGTVVSSRSEMELSRLKQRRRKILEAFGEAAYSGYTATGRLEIPAATAAELADIDARIRVLQNGERSDDA